MNVLYVWSIKVELALKRDREKYIYGLDKVHVAAETAEEAAKLAHAYWFRTRELPVNITSSERGISLEAIEGLYNE